MRDRRKISGVFVLMLVLAFPFARLFHEHQPNLTEPVLFIGTGNGPTLPELVGTPFKDIQAESRIFIDNEFSGLETNVIIGGFAEWVRATNGLIDFHVQPKGTWEFGDGLPDGNLSELKSSSDKVCSKDIYVVRLSSKSAVIRMIEKNTSTELAGYAHPGCDVKFILLVADRLRSELDFRTATIHEIGHMLGLQHFAVPGITVMYPNLGGARACVTPTDLVALCSLWRCKPEKLSPCPL